MDIGIWLWRPALNKLLEAERRTDDSPPSRPTEEVRLKTGCCGFPRADMTEVARGAWDVYGGFWRFATELERLRAEEGCGMADEFWRLASVWTRPGQ
jgi:hypothetical protein